MKSLMTLHGRMQIGVLTIVLPNGRSICVTGRNPGRSGEIRLNRWRTVRRAITAGGIGFGEAFMDGDWDSPDLPALIETLAANLPKREGLFRRLSPLRLANRLRHLSRPNSPKGSARNIASHYDLGNDFYALWLDPTMTYSAAVFSGGANDLEAAQREKYRRLLDLINPRPGDRILEVGCGWGGFAIHAAQEHDVHVTAITISRAQFEEARRRVAAAGLGGRVEIQLRDYRDLRETYDHAVSIEMIEAVGERYWRDYFASIAANVRSGGRFALQAIVIDDERFEGYRRSADFIQKHVFPGGLLPSPKTMRQEATAAGFDWHAHDKLGIDYAETLARWRARFEAAAERVHEMGFDERFRRCWTYYLSYCEGGFRAGNIDTLQVALTRR